MRSAVRLPVISVTISPGPQVLRSPGIWVFFTQLPFAYAKKSSPGGTDLSMPARSRPMDCAPSVAEAACGRTPEAELWQEGAARSAAARAREAERRQSFMVSFLSAITVYGRRPALFLQTLLTLTGRPLNAAFPESASIACSSVRSLRLAPACAQATERAAPSRACPHP